MLHIVYHIKISFTRAIHDFYNNFDFQSYLAAIIRNPTFKSNREQNGGAYYAGGFPGIYK